MTSTKDFAGHPALDREVVYDINGPTLVQRPRVGGFHHHVGSGRIYDTAQCSGHH